MRSTESIVEEYRKADLEKRLYLFLECPALRATFTEIDQSDSTPDVRRTACCGRETGNPLVEDAACGAGLSGA